MRAIILAAGRGSRLGSLTKKKPKSFVKIMGRSLISRILENFERENIKDIHIVTGYKSEYFKNYKYLRIHNNSWRKTNMFYSLTLAEKLLSEKTCIICYSDIFFRQSHLKKIINSKAYISVTYDEDWKKIWEKRFADVKLDAENFFIKNKSVKKIGGSIKDIDSVNGQYMGLLKITPKGWYKAKKIIKSIDEKKVKKISMTEILQILIDKKINITGIKIKGDWGEVDSPEDIIVYEELILDGKINGIK